MASNGSAERPRTWPLWLRLILALGAFGLIAYGPALSAPFIGDDYVFLDEVRRLSIPQLFERSHTAFGWYRPWSREVHFWTLRAVSGLEPTGYRAVSMVLWMAAMGLFAAFAGRVAGLRVAVIATLGLALCSFWGAPLLWISGSQDLWMVLFVMLTLYAHSRNRPLVAIPAFALGLLSKETAAVLPGVILAYDLCIDRCRLQLALRRSLPYLVMVAGWFMLHPTLILRLKDPVAFTVGTGPPLPAWLAVGRSALALVNADRPLNAFDWTAFDLFRTLASTAVIAAAWKLWQPVSTKPATTARPNGPILRFAIAWLVVGWLPLLVPSVGWQSYYGCLGACGAWLAFGLLLESRPRLVLPVLVCLGLLRGASAGTRSWDWGSEWYQRRAGNLLTLIQRDLKASKPQLPPHSRVFFGSIPNNIGLVAGQSPAIRVWYDDPTLEAGFYSYFRKRSASGPAGEDYFFHFDSTAGLTEVVLDPQEDVGAAVKADPGWEANHESVAATLFKGRDFERAALELEKLARLPWRADAQVFAAVAWERAGRLDRADALLNGMMSRTGGSAEEIRAWVNRVREASKAEAPE